MMTSHSDPAALRNFYDELERADWNYNYSESHAVWKAGSEQITGLRAMAAAKGPDAMALFAGFNAWSHDNGPRPERP